MDHKDLISQKTNSIFDHQFTKVLQTIPWQEWYKQDRPLHCRTHYLNFFDRWISFSKTNTFIGLEKFEQKHLINGTTQSFDETYFRHQNRRLRTFKGEYAYHTRIVKNHKFIEDAPLHENDYMIISAPFCSTGEVHPEMYNVIYQAGTLNIPVILDCAYFGTCVDLAIDVRSDAIESVNFSLSKGIGLGDIRSGVRYSNIDDDNPICQQNRYDHTILCAAKIGLYMMERFGPDFIPNKYREHQLSVCRDFDLVPTKCMHLALGGQEWNHYKIDGKYNRLGIRELVKARYKGKI